jgi:hypothetical protein
VASESGSFGEPATAPLTRNRMEPLLKVSEG